MIAPAAGIILTSDGLVLTNYHVINEGSFDFVRSANGQDFHGTVIEVDPSLDLALIQLDNASRLPTAKLSNHSTHVNVGDTVYAIGSPLGSHWKLPELQCLRTPKDFLKPGNSGGPLLDESGQVVGINRAIQDGTGEGVSIPIEIVKAFVGHR
jgi:S1-C subfamily serine protease